MSTATSARGYKRPWLRFLNCKRPNDALQLTSGGLMRASRASLMRRLQLSAVLYGPMRLARVFALIALAAPLLACDEYEKAYPDVAAAESGGAFKRGWIPAVLPADARNIVELHNLDHGEGWGCFDAPSGPATIREKLQVSGAKRVSGPVGPRPTQYLITRPWWPDSMNGTDVEVYDLARTDHRRYALGIDANGHRACFYRGSR